MRRKFNIKYLISTLGVLIFSFFTLIFDVSGLTCTSVTTGNWSEGSTWDTNPAIPANGDTVVITDGHTVTFDEDMSGWTNGVDLTINGTLQASETLGDYWLKASADIDGAGSIKAGTSSDNPYPSDCTFTIDFNGQANSIAGIGGLRLYLFCTHPTYKYVKLSAQEAIGQTVLSVDTDVTGDIWNTNDRIIICDNTTTPDCEETTINATSVTTITVNDALKAQKESGAVIILSTRNVRVTGGGADYLMKNIYYSNVHCEMDDCQMGSYWTIGTEYDVTINIGETPNNYPIHSMWAGSITGAVCNGNLGLRAIRGTTVTALIASFTYGIYDSSEVLLYGDICGCTYGISYGGPYIVFCDIDGATNALYRITNAKIYNTTFNCVTEFGNYSTVHRQSYDYVESFSHNGVDNTFKAWCRGGVVTSQTDSPPIGFSIWYEHTCESSSYPCFRQYQTVVLPGMTLEIQGKIRIADGDNCSTYPPALQIIDYFADPLVDNRLEPLDENEIPISDGSETDWQDVSVIWTNQEDIPRIVLVRMLAQHPSADIDEVWSIVDYKK